MSHGRAELCSISITELFSVSDSGCASIILSFDRKNAYVRIDTKLQN